MVVKKVNAPIVLVYVLAFYFVLGLTVASDKSATNIQEAIKNSIVGKAKAESQFYSAPYNGDACWNASFNNNLAPCPTPPDENIDICLVENDSTSVPLFFYTSNNVQDVYHASTLTTTIINQSPLTGLSVNPVFLSTTTPYLTDFNRLNYQLNLTAPSVSFGSSPLLTTLTVDGEFDVQGAPNFLAHLVTADVRMEHINTGPSLSSLNTGPYSSSLPSSTATINIPVSVNYGDDENNLSNITFELSKDGFATILQTQTYNSVAPGVVSHTFTNLGVGDYQWRVSAVEVDAAGNCIGYPNEDPPINLSTQAGPEVFTLTASTSDISYQLASTGESRFLPAVVALALLVTTGFGLAIVRIKGLFRESN